MSLWTALIPPPYPHSHTHSLSIPLSLSLSLSHTHSMFYRTHHQQFLFNLNYFPQFSPFSHFQEMESAKEDSGSGFEAETEEFSDVGGGGGAGEDFSVDELLDFSNGYSETEEQQLEEQRETERGKLKTTPLFLEREGAVSLPKRDDFGSLNEGDICFQAEGLESLEWLSRFMEDSFPDYSLAPNNAPAAAAAVVVEQPCFVTPVQTKARTKRARSGLHVWPVLSSSTEQSSSPPSSASSTTSFPPLASPLEIAPAKKQRKTAADGGGVAAQPRRCSHCGVTKTPQWRAGPLGSKTLCNACGVRYKSGRLLPEYRPACSPTFSTEMHSNSHRKVMEMRQKKETAVQRPPVQSF